MAGGRGSFQGSSFRPARRADRAGGTSGALWGAGLAALADHFSDETAITGADVVAGVQEAVRTVRLVGGAAVGDKTMVDALVPFAETLAVRYADGASLVTAWDEAARAAGSAAHATAELLPRRGRARTAGERNLGHVDAGAISFTLVTVAVRESLDHIHQLHRREE